MSTNADLVRRVVLVPSPDGMSAVSVKAFVDDRDGAVFVTAARLDILGSIGVEPVCDVYVGRRWLKLLAYRAPTLTQVLAALPRSSIKLDVKSLINAVNDRLAARQ